MQNNTLERPTPSTAPAPCVAGAASAEASPSLPLAPVALGSAALLAACGGGGGGGGDSAASAPAPVPPVAAPISAAEASRFLGQAGFGGTDAQISRVQALGYSGWLDEQFAAPRTQGHYDWMVEKGYAAAANINSFSGTDNTLWRKLISSPDVLRQRITLALSEVFVVSMTGLPINWRGFVAAAYMDVLEANAFGTYRTLLGEVTLSPGMGSYLNMRGNLREDAATGRVPDENYAREVLQLFSLGLVELAANGTLKNGVATDTYGQDTITGLAKVFTGWNNNAANNTEPGHAQRPMVLTAANHSPSAKQFLGVTIAASTPGAAALQTALDTIAAHPNVGPFIGRQLIQRLVTSQPSPTYVGRVAAVFNNNGSGVRGDLAAVVRAILLDSEARNAPDASFGKLREPVLRVAQWMRAMGARSASGQYAMAFELDSSSERVLNANSVFGYFRPGYVPPGTVFSASGSTVPEFQIVNESTVAAWLNTAESMAGTGLGWNGTGNDVSADYAALAQLVATGNLSMVIDHLNVLLLGGRMSAGLRQAIQDAVGSVVGSGATSDLYRARAAVFMTLASPEYLVQQ